MPEHTLARLDKVTAGYGRSPVFNGFSLSVRQGGFTCFCGPNGSGKSTALRLMRGLMRPQLGTVLLVDRPLGEWGTAELARKLALLSQHPQAPGDMCLRDLVMLGRYAHRRMMRPATRADREAVDKALAFTDLQDLSARQLGSLSGGQVQRAWIAMVLAQDAPAILLDEPTNHLDLGHALETMTLLRRLKETEGRTIIAVLHDLNLAARFADEVVLFSAGEVAAQGSVQEVLTAQTVGRVYGVDCDILKEPRSGRPMVVAHSL